MTPSNADAGYGSGYDDEHYKDGYYEDGRGDNPYQTDGVCEDQVKSDDTFGVSIAYAHDTRAYLHSHWYAFPGWISR